MVRQERIVAILIWYTMGVCTMLPWNFFITADSFWQYKLRNTTMGDAWDDPDTPLTTLQISFTPILVIVSNSFVFLFSFATSALTTRVAEKTRMLGSLFLSLFTMAVVTLLAFIDTDEWQQIFFIITMVMIALLNVGIAVMQGSLYGLVGLFPSELTSILYSGQAAAGVVSSLAMILSLAIGQADPITSGIVYFCIADLFLVLTTFAYLHLTKMVIYESCKREEKTSDMQTIKEKPKSFRDYVRVLKQLRWMGFTLGYVLCVTLAVFPAVSVYITSSSPPSTWTKIYFQPTVTFLLFNLMDMVGRELTRWILWPSHNGRLLHILGLARTVFIPLFLLCHGDNKGYPYTLFPNDGVYIFLNLIFALTNGYLGALTMVYYPRILPDEEVELGGTIMASLMGVGMVVGSAVSPGFVALWNPKT